jgi:hypothetical protein
MDTAERRADTTRNLLDPRITAASAVHDVGLGETAAKGVKAEGTLK